MTAGLVGQNQVATFATPVNGTSPIDANVVRSNDNTLKSSYDLHDSDSTIHFQSSLASARPVAGTAGRKWLDNDTFRVYYDDGANWTEIAYLTTSGGNFTGAVSITSNSAVALAVGRLGATTPAFTVDASTGSQVAGLKVVGAVTGGTVAVVVTDSGSNANLTVNAKGSGTIGIGSVSTGAVTITPATTIGGTLNVAGAGGLAIGSIAGRRRLSASGAETFELVGDSNAFASLGVLNLTGTGFIEAGVAEYIGFTGRSRISSPIDGGIQLLNAAATGFSTLYFGGTSSSFPALKVSGAGLLVRLGDDSANAAVTLGALGVTGSATLTGNLIVNSGVLNFSNFVGNAKVYGGSTGTTIRNVADTLDLVTISNAGAVGILSDLAVNTNKFTVAASSGNTVIAGTLGVTGDVTVNTNKFTVTASSGNTAVAGTLGVTGVSTLSAKLVISGVTSSIALQQTVTGDAIFNGTGSALATNAQVGFVFLPTCAGTPTNTPTNEATGIAPMVIDTSAGKLWVRYGSAWHFVTLT